MMIYRVIPQRLCLVLKGKEDEVVTVHPRAMFIPQEGCMFLAAGEEIGSIKT